MDFSDIFGVSDTGQPNSNDTDQNIDTVGLFQGKLIRLDQNIPTGNWFYTPLYKESLDGTLYTWQIGFNDSKMKIVTIKNGNIEEEYLESCNPGKDIRRIYINKWDAEYRPPYNPNFEPTKPMLAKKYKHPNDEGRLKNNETRIKRYPVSVIMKVHGIRGLAKLNPDNTVSIRSRENNEHYHLNHIRDELRVFIKYLPPGSELDGELYNHMLSFEKIKSAISTRKILHKDNSKIQYWVFDIIEPERLCWEERYSVLVNAYVKYLDDGHTSNTFRILQAHNVNNYIELDDFHDNFVKKGYEGLTIRKYYSVENDLKASQYRSGRNISLIKYKLFKDKEVEIISITNGITVKDSKNRQYKISYRNVLSEEDIGKDITIRYIKKDENGIPIEPVGVAIRDYE